MAQWVLGLGSGATGAEFAVRRYSVWGHRVGLRACWVWGWVTGELVVVMHGDM